MSNEDLNPTNNNITTTIAVMDDTTIKEDLTFIATHQLPQHTTNHKVHQDYGFVMQLAI
jgi:hypothetical protein